MIKTSKDFIINQKNKREEQDNNSGNKNNLLPLTCLFVCSIQMCQC